MAQPPNYCSYHNTGTATCVGHRAACATNRALTMSGNFTSGKVTAQDIDLLRTSILAEVDAYDVHPDYGPYTKYQPTAYDIDTTIFSDQHNDLETMVAYFNGPATSVIPSALISAADWIDVKSKYDSLRQNCICNADCACNAVCACHNDCGCNYA